MGMFPLLGVDQFTSDRSAPQLEAAFSELASILVVTRHAPHGMTSAENDISDLRVQFRQAEGDWTVNARGLCLELRAEKSRQKLWYFRSRKDWFPRMSAYITTENNSKAAALSARSAISSSADRVYWRSAWGYFGPPSLIYITIKSRAIHRRVGEFVADQTQIAAARELRAMCHQAALKCFGGDNNVRISSWWGGEVRFKARMECELSTVSRSAKFADLLSATGIPLAMWQSS